MTRSRGVREDHFGKPLFRATLQNGSAHRKAGVLTIAGRSSARPSCARRSKPGIQQTTGEMFPSLGSSRKQVLQTATLPQRDNERVSAFPSRHRVDELRRESRRLPRNAITRGRRGMAEHMRLRAVEDGERDLQRLEPRPQGLRGRDALDFTSDRSCIDLSISGTGAAAGV